MLARVALKTVAVFIFYFFLPLIFRHLPVAAESTDPLSEQSELYAKARDNINIIYADLLFPIQYRVSLKTRMDLLARKLNSNQPGLQDIRGDTLSWQQFLNLQVINALNTHPEDSLDSVSEAAKLPDYSIHPKILAAKDDVSDELNNDLTTCNLSLNRQSMEALPNRVDRAFARAAKVYPVIASRDDLANLLAFILIEVHELYWRPGILEMLDCQFNRLASEPGLIPVFRPMFEHLRATSANTERVWYGLHSSHAIQHDLVWVRFFSYDGSIESKCL